MTRAIGRVVAPIAALALVVLLVSLLASSDLVASSARPVDEAPATTTATTIIEFQLPVENTGTTVPPEAAAGSQIDDGQTDGGAPAGAGDGTSDDPTEASGSAGDASEQTYTIQEGDSPYGIAQRFGVSTQQLMELNEITDPTDLRVGEVLRIPSQ